MTEPPVRDHTVEILSDGWTPLKRHSFAYRRRDGTWEQQDREVYHRTSAASVLPYDPDRGTVLLVRQFRLPVYLSGLPGPMIEACAGLLDGDDPETCIRREAEEELGFRLREVRRVFQAFMSPGSITEQVTFFVAPYALSDRIGDGGGEKHEGEDIEVLELTFSDAMAMMRAGEIIDGKAIMLLQHAALAGLVDQT
jgi:nudix-type nucleoside diphosphatase (YffH/AdpP family)